MNIYENITQELRQAGSPDKAAHLSRFSKPEKENTEKATGLSVSQYPGKGILPRNIQTLISVYLKN